MSTKANIDEMSVIIQQLWSLELNETNLSKADILLSSMLKLRAIREELIAEREKRLLSSNGGSQVVCSQRR
jgi:hypothetical protein